MHSPIGAGCPTVITVAVEATSSSPSSNHVGMGRTLRHEASSLLTMYSKGDGV